MGNSINVLLAKPYQTLKGHLTESVQVLKFLYEREDHFFRAVYRRLIDFSEKNQNKFFENTKFEYKNLIELLLMLVYFHDIGKSSDEFQIYIKLNRGEDFKSRTIISHSYSSFYLLILILLKQHYRLSYNFLGNLLIYSLFSIMGHHGQLNDNSFQSNYLQKKQNFLKSDIKQIIFNYFELYESFFGSNKRESIFQPISTFDYNLDIIKLPNNQDGIKIDEIVQQMIANIKDNTKISNDDIIFIKYWFCFCYSLLKLCDESASQLYQTKERDLRKKFEENGNILEKSIKECDKLENFSIFEKIDYFYKSFGDIVESNTILPSNFFLNEIQREISNEFSKFVLIRLGCGMGKTAAALFYAKNLSKTKDFNNIIFTLPTQFTSNSIIDDLVEQYNFIPENLGLYHGNAEEFWDNYFKKDEKDALLENEEILENQKNSKKKIQFAKVFNFPITVTTVDHLILSLIHGFKQADKSIINILHSMVIFDELHYYEPHTLEIILELQNILRCWNVPHLIMSGTMPDKILEYYGQKDYKIYDWNGKFQLKNGDYEDRTPFALKMILNPLIFKKNKNFSFNEEFKKLILINLSNKSDIILKQIIFVNTVERTKIIYELLANLLNKVPNKPKVIVYHSQFTKRDKIKKERKIKKLFNINNNNQPVILITTQITEFSLNISSDVMFSEMAPLDSLFQRAGRLHRGGFRSSTKECSEMSKNSYYGECKNCSKFQKNKDFEYNLYIFLPEGFPLEIINSNEDLAINLNRYKKIIIENQKKGIFINTNWINPYNIDVLINSIIYLIKKIGSEYYRNINFREICKLVSVVYKDIVFSDSVEFKQCFRNNAIFGDKPSDILFGSNPKIIIRPQKYLNYQIVPFKYLNCDNIEEFSIPISFSKYLKIEKKFGKLKSDKGFFVMPPEIQYSYKIGFDFSPLAKDL